MQNEDECRKVSYIGFTGFCKSIFWKIEDIVVVVVVFLLEFSFTDTEDTQDSRGREGTIFYSTVPLPPAQEHSNIYLQLCMWNDYHIFLIAPLVYTRLLLDEFYLLIELELSYWITLSLYLTFTFQKSYCLFPNKILWFLKTEEVLRGIKLYLKCPLNLLLRNREEVAR